jgi:hypothetical protein
LCDDAVGGDDECNRLLDNVPNFDNVFVSKTTEEAQEALDSFMNSLDGEASESDVYVPADNPPQETSGVLAAFNELTEG